MKCSDCKKNLATCGTRRFFCRDIVLRPVLLEHVSPANFVVRGDRVSKMNVLRSGRIPKE